MHECVPENAQRFAGWITSRGGLAVWKSINLSNMGVSWTTPAKNEDGTPTTKPSWQSDNAPSEIITDPSQVVVIQYELKKRFHVGIRRGDGFSFKLTDAASRRVKNELAKAGEGATYEFDYEYQDCLILVPKSSIPLPEFLKEQ